MTEPEYRQDDRTEGYCPICGEPVTNVMVDGGGWCPDHGRVWCDWTPRKGGGTVSATWLHNLDTYDGETQEEDA